MILFLLQFVEFWERSDQLGDPLGLVNAAVLQEGRVHAGAHGGELRMLGAGDGLGVAEGVAGDHRGRRNDDRAGDDDRRGRLGRRQGRRLGVRGTRGGQPEAAGPDESAGGRAGRLTQPVKGARSQASRRPRTGLNTASSNVRR